MKYLKDKRIIGCISLSVIFIIGSFWLYGNSKNKVFKDEYMKGIFVEENTQEEQEVLVSSNNVELNKPEIVVEIKGEVLNPDVYTLDEGSIIKDLIDVAGGLTEDGDISRINRADMLKNHQLIIVPNKNDIEDNNNFNISMEQGTSPNGSLLININTANLEELKQISGVGDSKAQNIINYRETNGNFKSIEEIKNVDGIGEKTFEKLKDQITY